MSDAYAVTKQCRKSLFYFIETHHVCFVHLDKRLQILRDLLSSVTVPASTEDEETPTMSAWTQIQLTAQKKFRAAMPELLNCKLAAETVKKHCCQQCKTADAVVRCLDCVPSGTQFLCPACDSKVHKKYIFHDREAMIYVFFKPIPPTSSVMLDQSGQYQLAEQGMLKECKRCDFLISHI